MIHVESSAMTDVDYLPDAHILRIHFESGEWYRYFDVPSEAYTALVTADSPGRHFHDHIRDRYPYERE